MVKRTSDIIRAERAVIGEQIEKLRKQQKALSDELRVAEGPIPDRPNRPTKDVGFTMKPATV